MTFWEWIGNNKVKILGSLTTLVAFILGAIALGQFDATVDSPALLGPVTVRWLSIILGSLNVLLGGGTIAAGLSNSTKEKVAEARAETAADMRIAILSTPPGRPI